MSLSKSDKYMVTDHAMVRFLERVEGYDLTEIRDALAGGGLEPQDHEILDMLEIEYGLTRDYLVNRVAPETVRNAVKAGAKRIRMGQWTWVIVERRVVTIEPRTSPVARKERVSRIIGKRKPVVEDRGIYQYHRGKMAKLRGNQKRGGN